METEVFARFCSMETRDRIETLTQRAELSQFAVDYFFKPNETKLHHTTNRLHRLIVCPVASLGLVLPGAATDGCHPIFC